MPVITDIKTQIKNQDKVSVYVDGKYSFALTLNQLTEQKEIRINSELSTEQVEDLKRLSKLTNQYIRMIALVYARPRSEYEIRTKLRQKKVEPEEVEELVSKLRSNQYLDDEKFTEWWVNGRKSSRPVSKLKLKSELAQKGIKAELANQVILEHFSEEEELQILKSLIAKKKDKYETEQKLMAYLASKGFNYSQIKTALSNSEDKF